MKKFKDNDLSRYDETLSRYLKGQLSNIEEVEFKKQLAEDSELRNKAIATVRLAKAMNQIGSTDDRAITDSIKVLSVANIETVAAKACGIQTAKPKILNFSKFIVSFSTAASILLCVFGGYKYYQYDRTTSLGAEYLAYFPASEFSRGESNDIDTKLKELYSCIEKKQNLDASIADLSTMWDESRGNTYNGYTEHMLEIGWMLANAYLRDNDKTKALEVLDILTTESPERTVMGNKARELKAKIEKL